MKNGKAFNLETFGSDDEIEGGKANCHQNRRRRRKNNNFKSSGYFRIIFRLLYINF